MKAAGHVSWGGGGQIEAAQRIAARAAEAGLPLQLHLPNLPPLAEEGEARRLARKPREENPEYEWRGDPYLQVMDPAVVCDLLRWLREQCGFVQLYDLSAVDPAADAPELWVVYGLLNLAEKVRLELRLGLNKEHLSVPSVVAVHQAADWHEREAAEMFGIVFEGHPDPRALLLPEDWDGFPLRKDYEFPDQYQGISCT